METYIETDVLVIGGGGAGFRAAIGAREADVKVLLVSKGPIARCGATPMAGADYTLDGRSLHDLGFEGEPNDSPDKVFNDILTQGFFLNNRKLLAKYVENAPIRLKELIDWGLKITGSAERAIYTDGLKIMDLLLKKARAYGVELIEDVMILDLIVRDGAIAGAVGLDVGTGGFVHIRAKAAIIATGGWHKAFWPNTGMRDLSGEGIAMALRAGAELANMEFITFCCNVFYEPPMWRGSIAPYIIGLSCGARLTNSAGEQFLDRYDPFTVRNGTRSEWDKCFTSYATAVEIRNGRSCEGGGVHFTRGEVPWEDIEAVASDHFPKWKYKAIDMSEFGKKLRENEPVLVGPAAEYFDGGIIVDDNYATCVDGLYAAGECTCGPFGANRVFSAITEIIVQGADAGKNAGEYAKKAAVVPMDKQAPDVIRKRAEKFIDRKHSMRPGEVRRYIQVTAHSHLGPVRSGNELESFAEILKDVRFNVIPQISASSNSRIYNKEWIDILEFENTALLLDTAVRSAMERTESRGVHFREDYPDTDNDNWLRNNIVTHQNDTILVEPKRLKDHQPQPPAGNLPYLEMMKKMMKMRSDIGGSH